MKKTSVEIQRLRSKEESALNKTAQLQQALAQIEANLSREESQKVTEKSKNKQTYVYQDVSNLEILFTYLENDL